MCMLAVSNCTRTLGGRPLGLDRTVQASNKLDIMQHGVVRRAGEVLDCR